MADPELLRSGNMRIVWLLLLSHCCTWGVWFCWFWTVENLNRTIVYVFMNASALIQHLNIALVHIAAQSHILCKDWFDVDRLLLCIVYYYCFTGINHNSILYTHFFDCHIGIQYNDHHLWQAESQVPCSNPWCASAQHIKPHPYI